MIKRGKLETEHWVGASAKTNPKVFYAFVNSRKTIKNVIGPLNNAHGIVISNDEGMADLPNLYFASVCTEEDLQEMPSVPALYQGNELL